MSSRARLSRIVDAGDDALIARAKSDAEGAWSLPRLTISDLRDLPCPRRAKIVARTTQRIVDKRDEINFKIGRVNDKLRVAAGDRDRDVTKIVKAWETLDLARRHLDELIKQARVVRKHTTRACRRK